MHIHCNIILKKNKFWCMLQHGWNLTTLISLSKQANIVWFHSDKVLRAVIFYRENRIVVARDLRGAGEGGRMEELFNGYRVLVLQDEKNLEIGCTTVWMNCMLIVKTLCIFHNIFHLKMLLREKSVFPRLPQMCSTQAPALLWNMPHSSISHVSQPSLKFCTTLLSIELSFLTICRPLEGKNYVFSIFGGPFFAYLRGSVSVSVW